MFTNISLRASAQPPVPPGQLGSFITGAHSSTRPPRMDLSVSASDAEVQRAVDALDLAGEWARACELAGALRHALQSGEALPANDEEATRGFWGLLRDAAFIDGPSQGRLEAVHVSNRGVCALPCDWPLHGDDTKLVIERLFNVTALQHAGAHVGHNVMTVGGKIQVAFCFPVPLYAPERWALHVRVFAAMMARFARDRSSACALTTPSRH
jgi:hypothetical protein